MHCARVKSAAHTHMDAYTVITFETWILSCFMHLAHNYWVPIHLSTHVSHPSIQSTLSSLDSWLMFKPLIIYCTIEASSLILTSAIHAWTASAFGGMIIADRQDQFTGAAHSFLKRMLKFDKNVYVHQIAFDNAKLEAKSKPTYSPMIYRGQ